MKRALKFGLLGLLSLALLFLVFVYWALNDEAFLRGQLESRLSASLGRELSIEGLTIDAGTMTRIRLRGVRLANVSWAQASSLASIGSLDARIDLSALFERGLQIDSLAIENARVNLEEDATGRVNWLLGRDEDGRADDGEEPSRRTRIPWKSLRLTDFELTHVSPRREVPLEFRVEALAAQQSSDGRMDIAGNGVVGGHALSVDGFVDPLGALFSGGRVSHRLQVEIGENRLVSEGTILDVITGSGADLEIGLSGPDFAWLLKQAALPEFSSGPFDARVTLDMADDRSVDVRVEGDLGRFEARATGAMNRLVDPSVVALDFQVSGPDLEALGQALGVDQLPKLPYHTRGSVRYEEGTVEVKTLEAEVGPDRLALSGRVGAWPDLAGTVLDVSVAGEDIGVWTAAMGLKGVRPNVFSLNGRFLEQGGVLAVDEATFTLAEASLELDGTAGSMPDFLGADLDLELMVPDPGGVARLDAYPLPSAPVRVSGSLRRDQTGLVADGLIIELEGVTAQLSGLIAIEPGERLDGTEGWQSALSGSRLAASVTAPDAGRAGALFGQPWLPAHALELDLSARLEADRLALEASSGQLGEASFTFQADLDPGRGVTLQRGQVSASGPNFRQLYDATWLSGLPGPFHFEASVTTASEADRIESLKLKLGAISLDAEGEVTRLLDPASANLTIRLEVPELEELHPFLGGYTDGKLPSGPFNLSSDLTADLRAVRPLISLSGVSAKLDGSDLTGHVAFAPGEVPEIVGSLQSEALDLSWLLAEGGETGNQAREDAGGAPQRVFSDEPLPLRTLDPFYLDLGVRVGRLSLGRTIVQEIRLGVAMTAEELSLEPLELKGPLGRRLSGTLRVTRRGGSNIAEMKGTGEGFRFALALAKGQDIATAPPVDIYVDLTASGSTMHEMALSALGGVSLIIGAGQWANQRLDLIFSDVLTELFEKLNPFVKESTRTNLECGVLKVSFEGGKATIDPLIFQTDKIVASSTGTVNLQTEKISLAFNTRPRQGIGITPGLVINPFIALGGTLARPTIALDPAGAAVSGGAAVATGGLSLLGKSLFDRFLRESDPCGRVVSELRTMPDDGAARP